MRCTRRVCVVVFLITTCSTITQAQEPGSTPAMLTLQEAIQRALIENPELKTFAWELRAADADITQAGLRPNPELSLEIEDIRWSPGPAQRSTSFEIGATPGLIPAVSWNRESEQGARSGLAESEITLSLSQVIELGGKRAKRIALAEKAKRVTMWDYEAVRANVITAVARAFTSVLVTQERVVLHEEIVSLAEDVVRATSLRVTAGKVSPIERDRAEIVLAEQRIATERARYALESARVQLATLWGDVEPNFERAVGRLDNTDPVPPFRDLQTALNENPDIRRWAAEIEARDAVRSLEQARRIPDITVAAGFRTTGLPNHSASGYGVNTGGDTSWSRTRIDSDSSRDNRLVLGFSLPLPLFDRNQGDIARAEAMSSKASAERRATEQSAVAQLAESRANAAAAYDEIAAMRDEILPRVTANFSKTQRGYEAGKFSYLSVLDAQQALFEARTRHLGALEQYHQANIAIQRLTGDSLSPWESTDGDPPHED